MSLPTDLRIKITSADGSIDRLVPQSKLFTPSWSIERYGGYGEFSLPTGLDYRTFTRVQQGDMVEVYFQGVRKYRGYVTERKRSNDNPRKLSLSAYGAAFWLRKVPVSKTYAFPAGATDVSVAFAQFCNDFLLGNVGPGGIQLAYSVQAETIGTTILNLDARYKSAGDVLDAIIGETGNLAVWGVDVDSEGYNRIYLRPFSDTTPPNNPDFVIFAPGINVEASEGPETIADVVNAVIVQGGAAKFPQLLHNGNFELPVYQNDGAGNMVLNGGFESGGFHVADDWTLANGASVESGKNQSPARAVAFEGSRYLELDHVSENAVQNGTGTWAAGHNYVFSCQMAKEVDQQSLSGHARLIIKDGTSAVVFDSGSVTMQPPGQDWEYFSIPFTFPTSGFTAGSGTFQITFNLDSITAFGGQQGGLIIDAVELQDVSVVYQDGWEIQATGDAVINSVNWVCQESYEGAYSLYVDGSTFADADARDVEIIPASGQVSNNYQNTNKVKVQTGQSLRFAGWFKSPSFPSIHPNFPALLLIFDWLDSSSNFLSQSRIREHVAGRRRRGQRRNGQGICAGRIARRADRGHLPDVASGPAGAEQMRADRNVDGCENGRRRAIAGRGERRVVVLLKRDRRNARGSLNVVLNERYGVDHAGRHGAAGAGRRGEGVREPRSYSAMERHRDAPVEQLPICVVVRRRVVPGGRRDRPVQVTIGASYHLTRRIRRSDIINRERNRSARRCPGSIAAPIR
jgi:hypothetical protein